MRNQNFEYFTPTDAEFKDLWQNALFAFDANVLLSLIRYKDSAKEEVLNVMKELGANLWLPHQACVEFLRNRHKVFYGLQKPFDEISNIIETQIKEFNSKLDGIIRENKNHPSIDFEQIKSAASRSMKDVEKVLTSFKEKHPSFKAAEKTVDDLNSIFKDRTGGPFDPKDIEGHTKEALRRIAAKIPPGYEDSKKDDGGVGDYFIWRQLIEKAKLEKRPIIFITEDVKDDWWLRVNGKTIGPLPALRREFFDEAGQYFYAYRVVEFLSRSNSIAAPKVSKATLEEAGIVSKSWIPRTYKYRPPHGSRFLGLRRKRGDLIEKVHKMDVVLNNPEHLEILTEEDRNYLFQQRRKASVEIGKIDEIISSDRGLSARLIRELEIAEVNTSSDDAKVAARDDQET